MALTKEEYTMWNAERFMQALVMKYGYLEEPQKRIGLMDAAFKMSSEFTQHCEDKKQKPWERESL